MNMTFTLTFWWLLTNCPDRYRDQRRMVISCIKTHQRGFYQHLWVQRYRQGCQLVLQGHMPAWSLDIILQSIWWVLQKDVLLVTLVLWMFLCPHCWEFLVLEMIVIVCIPVYGHCWEFLILEITAIVCTVCLWMLLGISSPGDNCNGMACIPVYGLVYNFCPPKKQQQKLGLILFTLGCICSAQATTQQMFANSARGRTTSSAPPATSVLALMGHSAVWLRGPVTWPFCAMTLFRWWQIQSWLLAPPTFLLYVLFSCSNEYIMVLDIFCVMTRMSVMSW